MVMQLQSELKNDDPLSLKQEVLYETLTNNYSYFPERAM